MIKSSPLTKSISAIFYYQISLPKYDYPASKYRLDMVLALCVLLALAPLFLIVALLIKADSKGPVFFVQKRSGKNGQCFPLIKFRTMFVNCQSSESLKRTQASDRTGICTKFKKDPRVTRVGRFLRKLSIDELPQLFNVLKGEMSLVGPRPALPCEVAKYDYQARRRLEAIPGITGLWQISGRANLNFNQQIELDLYYIQHANLLLDLKIMFLTVPAIISCNGAY